MRPAESTTLPPEIRTVKTMLSAQELERLYLLAKDQYTGRGEIVDGGAFLGGSTMALACGLRDNPGVQDKNGRVHSYDLFRADSHVPQFIGPLPPGASTRPYYDEVVAPVASHVSVHEGDITLMPWPSTRDIEILFVDVAKSWTVNDFLLQHFFPRLVPGVSSIIQRDYHGPDTPWIPITMELLADHVTYLGSTPWPAAHYRWERALEPGELPARLRDLGINRLRQLANLANRFECGSREWTAQQCNLVSLCQSFGLADDAMAIYDDAIDTAPAWVDYLQFRPNLRNRAA
jgi:hypothetical protein